MQSTVQSFRTPDGVTLGVEHFGDAAAPLVLLAGGTTMLSWPDTLCETLARGRRHVVRYDLRDSGASTSTARPEPSPRSSWPTSWAWCSPSSTARHAGARLLVLEQAATAIPDAAAHEVAAAMVAL